MQTHIHRHMYTLQQKCIQHQQNTILYNSINYYTRREKSTATQCTGKQD
jgi:hypothetical protein